MPDAEGRWTERKLGWVMIRPCSSVAIPAAVASGATFTPAVHSRRSAPPERADAMIDALLDGLRP